MHGPQRILQRARVFDVFGELTFEGGGQRVTARRELGVPAREIGPAGRCARVDVHRERVGRGRERLALNLLYVRSGPRVDTAPARLHVPALEMNVAFLD